MFYIYIYIYEYLFYRKKTGVQMSALEEEVKKVQGKLVASEKNKNRLALEVEDLAQELEAVSPRLAFAQGTADKRVLHSRLKQQARRWIREQRKQSSWRWSGNRAARRLRLRWKT